MLPNKLDGASSLRGLAGLQEIRREGAAHPVSPFALFVTDVRHFFASEATRFFSSSACLCFLYACRSQRVISTPTTMSHRALQSSQVSLGWTRAFTFDWSLSFSSSLEAWVPAAPPTKTADPKGRLPQSQQLLGARGDPGSLKVNLE